MPRSYPEAGSPQGGVVSSWLSNVFLRYVLDLWFDQVVRPRLRRRAFLIRYADDFAIGFRDHRDAQRVMDVAPKRFGKYGLTVHPTKTRLVPFCPPSPGAKRFDVYEALRVYWGDWSQTEPKCSGGVVRCFAQPDRERAV
jgi:RNA-directed DNA polymerase